MNIPIETKPALWGLAGGVALAVFVGFTWGGWVTGRTADVRANERADAAVVAALAPLCVERFQAAPQAQVSLGELKKADSWAQAEFVEKGGWATMPGTARTGQVTQVARACAALLAA